MPVSVIIPSRNRAEALKASLESLQRQTLPADGFEIIVVDNGSTDHTEAVARTFAASLQLIYTRKEEPGLHVGRHEGLRLARSDLLIFADDDIEAEPTWLEAISTAFDDPAVAMVGGNNYPAFEEEPPAWLQRLWERPVYKGRALDTLSVLDFGHGRFEIDPGYVWGCNFSIRRDILLRAGGFHPDGVPKERLRYRGDGETHVSNYVRGSGLKAGFDSRASVHHSVSRERMTKDYFCRRYYAQGVSDSYSACRAAGGVPQYQHRLRLWSASVCNRAKNALKRVLPSSDPVEAELANVLMAAQQAYWEGYRFHMKEIASDPALSAWVLKESYL